METLSRPIRLIPSMALVFDRITRAAEPYRSINRRPRLPTTRSSKSPGHC